MALRRKEKQSEKERRKPTLVSFPLSRCQVQFHVNAHLKKLHTVHISLNVLKVQKFKKNPVAIATPIGN